MDKSTTRIILFIGIALTWSFAWFSQRHLLNNFFNNIQSIAILFLGLVPTVGLIIGSFLFRQKLEKREVRLAGNNLSYSIVIISIPIICLTIIGIENIFGFQKNLFGAFIGIFTMIYAFFEEYGWRGYLQEELLSKFNKWIVYIIVGIIWYSWHWYFLREGNNAKLIMIPILIAASAGIGEIAKSTKSLLICAAVHGIVNILIIYSIISNQLSSIQKIIILAICLVFWIPLIWKLEKQNTAASKS
jgi:membrane protease YdiL (CAAX protease family)